MTVFLFHGASGTLATRRPSLAALLFAIGVRSYNREHLVVRQFPNRAAFHLQITGRQKNQRNEAPSADSAGRLNIERDRLGVICNR